MRNVLSFKAVDAAQVIEADHISKVYPKGTLALLGEDITHVNGDYQCQHYWLPARETALPV